MNFKFIQFKKGWAFNKPHLTSQDGFNNVNNFVIYGDAIEKVHGWKLLSLTPVNGVVDDFTTNVIDDYTDIINTVV